MAQLIKIKQSDIVKIVMEVMSSQEFDDNDVSSQLDVDPEELKQVGIDPEDVDDPKGRTPPPLMFGTDKNGNIALFDTVKNIMMTPD